MQQDREQKADEVADALAQLLDAIAAEPVPARIRTLAEELREALLARQESRPR